MKNYWLQTTTIYHCSWVYKSAGVADLDWLPCLCSAGRLATSRLI
jgi:hypothetical protein